MPLKTPEKVGTSMGTSCPFWPSTCPFDQNPAKMGTLGTSLLLNLNDITKYMISIQVFYRSVFRACLRAHFCVSDESVWDRRAHVPISVQGNADWRSKSEGSAQW